MATWVRPLLSGLCAGLMSGAGALLTAGQSGIVDRTTWLMAGCVAIIALAKDVQAALMMPPRGQ